MTTKTISPVANKQLANLKAVSRAVEIGLGGSPKNQIGILGSDDTPCANIISSIIVCGKPSDFDVDTILDYDIVRPASVTSKNNNSIELIGPNVNESRKQLELSDIKLALNSISNTITLELTKDDYKLLNRITKNLDRDRMRVSLNNVYFLGGIATFTNGIAICYEKFDKVVDNLVLPLEIIQFVERSCPKGTTLTIHTNELGYAIKVEANDFFSFTSYNDSFMLKNPLHTQVLNYPALLKDKTIVGTIDKDKFLEGTYDDIEFTEKHNITKIWYITINGVHFSKDYITNYFNMYPNENEIVVRATNEPNVFRLNSERILLARRD